MDDRQQLEEAIAALESQRHVLGDAVVDIALAPLFQKLVEIDRSKQQKSGSIEGERRHVTVFFSDVVGSTALAEQLDPEEWTEIMNAAFEHLIKPVERYGGTVARLMGDAILAFFGAPIAHEDDPERAVLAGLSVLDRIRPFQEALRRERGLEFQVRVGINTGLVVVGQVGSEIREYTAMGDAVNLAARMEQTAAPETVQIAEGTYRLVASLFEFEQLGGIEVKGKGEPVLAYRVLGRRPVRLTEQHVGEPTTPFVGRKREMDLLRQAVADVRQGRGQVVSLIGEAGLGKSRLIAELRREWLVHQSKDSPSQWNEMGATSYGSTQPYSTFKDQLRIAAGITPTDQPAAARAKLNVMLQDDLRHEFLQGVFEKLLGIQAENTLSFEGENFRRELFESVLEATKAEIGGQPSVYIFDDMHWTDSASLALEAHLLQLTRSEPVLVLFGFRPDQNAPIWQLRKDIVADYEDRYTEIVLSSLSEQESQQLISELASAQMTFELQQNIMQKTGGNPFFVEEVLKSLPELGTDQDNRQKSARGSLSSSGIVPESVQTLLLSRIDRLDTQTRQTLQLASIIGRTFYERVLRYISEKTIALDHQLEMLQQREMILEAGRIPELSYIFRHDLTRDAAYQSMLQSQRRRLHRKVGQALEALYPERIEDEANLLAYHFDAAGDEAEALKYYSMAGDRADELFAGAEAVKHYTRAIELAKIHNNTNEWLIRLYTNLGRTYELNNQYDEALAAYQELEALAHDRKEPALELAALIPWAVIHATLTLKFDPEQGRALANRALALARELDDPQAEARALWALMLTETYGSQGDGKKALIYGRQSEAIARKNDLHRELAYALHDMWGSLSSQENFKDGLDAMEEARELWRELNDRPMLADNLIITSGFHLSSGDIEKALALAEEGREIGLSMRSPWSQSFSLTVLGEMHTFRGDAAAGIQAFQEAIPLAEQANFAWPIVTARLELAQAYGAMGALDKGFTLAEQAKEAAEAMGGQGASFFENSVPKTQARLYLSQGNLKKAKASIRQAYGPSALREMEPIEFGGLGSGLGHLTLAEVALADQAYEPLLLLTERAVDFMQTTSRPGRSNWLYLRAQTLLKINRVEEAHQALLEARDEAQTMLARPTLWKILALLSELARQRGDDGLARQLRRESAEIVNFIADHAGSQELTASFLALPEVQTVLGDMEDANRDETNFP